MPCEHVNLTLSASTAGLSGRDRIYRRTGGFGAACAAVEDLSRTLAAEQPSVHLAADAEQ
jgi:hypothetical protein